MNLKLKKLALCGLLAMSPIVAAYADNPAKVINIYNNSTQTIWPVVEVGVSQDASHVWIYRMYLPAIKAGDTKDHLVTLPDQSSGVNWWKGGRVYIFNQDPHDQPLPDCQKLPPNKEGYSVCLDKKGIGFNSDLPYQLVEYTLTDKLADYDISYVDHLFLPLAVEVNQDCNSAAGCPIGYNGTDMSIADFQNKLHDFITATQWPYYNLPVNPNLPPNTYNFKIPGAYNLFAQDQTPASYYKGQMMLVGNRSKDQDGTNHTAAENYILKQWAAYTTPGVCDTYNTAQQGEFCKNFQQTVTDVAKIFTQDAKNNGVIVNDQSLPAQIVQHIIGYVPFQDNEVLNNMGDPNLSKKAIALEEGIPYDADRFKYINDKYPAYDSKYNLNPFVNLVHKQLKLSAYAFSIDDAIGNVNVPGNGLTIAVGGLNGIANKHPYVNPASYKYEVSPGPGWSNATVCGTKYTYDPKANPVAEPLTSLVKQNDTCVIQYGTGSTPIVSITADIDANNKLAIKDCQGVGSICQNVIADNVGNSVDLPAPPSNNQPWAPITPPAHSGTLMFGSGWKTADVCGTKYAPAPGSAPMTDSCQVALTSGSNSLSFLATLQKGASNYSISNCNGTGTLCAQISPNGGTYVSLPSVP